MYSILIEPVATLENKTILLRSYTIHSEFEGEKTQFDSNFNIKLS